MIKDIFKKDIKDYTKISKYTVVEDCIERFYSHINRGVISISSIGEE